MLDLGKSAADRFQALAPPRPGCWINILPAQGLVLLPEARAGCELPEAAPARVLRASHGGAPAALVGEGAVAVLPEGAAEAPRHVGDVPPPAAALSFTRIATMPVAPSRLIT